MKKISIRSQIVILFIVIVLISTSAFTALVLNRVNNIAERETYTRLLGYSNVVDAFETDRDPVDFRDMTIAFAKVKNNNVIKSTNIDDFLNESDSKMILEVLDKNNDKQIIFRKFQNHEGKTIYYVLTTADYGQNYIIVLTDSGYVSNIVNNISFSLILIFVVTVFLSVLVVVIWTTYFVRRLHRIKTHVLNLPKNSYEESYVDNGLDEVGELSRAVEEMRKEIQANEKTKQEMLQNISHDFKTPIAVIKSYAEAQQDGMADEESSKIIINQAELLKKKVNRLLQYNSLEYLNKDKEFEDIDMKQLILEVLETYKYQTTIKFELDLTEDIYFKGYKENYYTIIDNILDNARRYAKSIIKIILKKDRLRIYNDGEPIDEQFLKYDFKPYEKGSKGEFGLGMSIVQKTVDFFGMELIVVNEDVGVSFIITKPQKQ